MKYKGIIFDLDGVICHTDQYHYQAWKKLSDKLGVYFDEEINNLLRGVSRMESLDIILKRYEGTPLSLEEKTTYVNEKNELYLQLLQHLTPKDLSEEVKRTLDKLRERNIKQAIGSSSKNAVFILTRLGLSEFFDAISDGNNITNSKPNPEVFLKAAEFLGLKPEECLVVEDAVVGVQAATRGNMDCAAIGDAAKANIATYSLTSFLDLLRIAL